MKERCRASIQNLQESELHELALRLLQKLLRFPSSYRFVVIHSIPDGGRLYMACRCSDV